MKIKCVRILLWVIEKLFTKPDDMLALELCKTAGKFMTWAHQSIYYKDNVPLWNPLYKPPTFKAREQSS